MKTTLAQTLTNIKQLKGDLATWESRLTSAVIPYQPTDLPVYSFAECLSQVNAIRGSLIDLKQRLNRRNATIPVQYVTLEGDTAEATISDLLVLVAETQALVKLHTEFDTGKAPEYSMEKTAYKNGQYVQVIEQYKSDYLTRDRDNYVSALKAWLVQLHAVLDGANYSNYL